MTPEEARRVRIGASVRWESSGERGCVAGRDADGITVLWYDGERIRYPYAVTHSGLLHVQTSSRRREQQP